MNIDVSETYKGLKEYIKELSNQDKVNNRKIINKRIENTLKARIVGARDLVRLALKDARLLNIDNEMYKKLDDLLIDLDGIIGDLLKEGGN